MGTGAVAANLHEGSRSEYLAQYVFASFGTAIPVPHQEDSGIDLYCTLTERVGQRAWARAHFAVQVKSTRTAWLLEGRDSVRWLVEHPWPLFLCVVDKRRASIALYHTSPRFYVWSMPPIPERLELTPGEGRGGQATEWTGGTSFSLGGPIIEASVQELLDDATHSGLRAVLQSWVDVDVANLWRKAAAMHAFSVPAEYRTNEVPDGGRISQGARRIGDLGPALAKLSESLGYLSSQFHLAGNAAAAVRCAMLLRQLFPDEVRGDVHDVELHRAVSAMLRRDDYIYSGVDELNRIIDQALQR